MKIGFDGRYFFENKGGVAGLHQYSTLLLTKMAEVAPDNSYLLYLRQANLEASSDVLPVSIKPRFVKTGMNLPTSIWFQSSFPNALRNDKPDILHCPDFLAPFWNFGSYIPRVITIHDLNVLRFKENFTPRTYWAWRLQAQISSRRAALILTDSEASKKDIIKMLKIPEHKIKITLLAADPLFKPASSQEIERVKIKFGLSNYIFWIGSLIPQKNLVRLLQAFAILKKDHKINHKLVLGGRNAWGSTEYSSLIKDLGLEGQVLLPGFVDLHDLVPLYSGADLFVFPSLNEGFGLPILEAMSCGAAVATSNVSSMPEVGGDAAAYFNPTNVESIASTMHDLLANPDTAQAFRKRGLERVKMFSWVETAQQTLEAYQEVVSNSKKLK